MFDAAAIQSTLISVTSGEQVIRSFTISNDPGVPSRDATLLSMTLTNA